MARINKRLWVARLLFYSGVVLAVALVRRAFGVGGPLFVMLHRVLPAEAAFSDPVDRMALLSRHAITPEEMRRRLVFLRRWVMPCGDPAELRRGMPAGRAFYITFDDGYIDNVRHAAPVLEQLGMRGVLFVVAEVVAHPDAAPWWDRWGAEALEQHPGPSAAGAEYGRRCGRAKAVFRGLDADDLAAQSVRRYLNRSELDALPACLDVANHTAWHANLTMLDAAERARHIDAGEEPIRDHPRRLPLLAFPFGAHDDALVRQLRERGDYAIAFATGGGHALDPQRARRMNMNIAGHALFAAQAVGLLR